MAKAKILVEENLGQGIHNSDLGVAQDRLIKGASYKDVSTICIVPTRGLISSRVVQSWMGLMAPMNQKFTRIFVEGMEVGEAYNSAIEMILANPELSKWKYILTLEEDNSVPPDGLLKLIEAIQGYDVVGGLYWTKGDGGAPMIYGNPREVINFIPQIPQPETIQECNGLGMGFTLFKIDIFKDKKLPKPWFKTLQEFQYGQGVKAYTQDLYFFENIKKLGYRVASDNRVRVGHWDQATETMW